LVYQEFCNPDESCCQPFPCDEEPCRIIGHCNDYGFTCTLEAECQNPSNLYYCWTVGYVCCEDE
jgi:hypothetical protein